MKKKNFKFIFGILIGIVISAGSVYAANVASSSISYNNSKSGLSATNLQDAIDETYNKVKNNCPDGYACNKPICKRATSLHSSGSTTYGNLGTKGTLAAGNAFDCDVNGDGVYNATNERFYYVIDLNKYVAVLIYYNNTAGGVANSSQSFSYGSSSQSGPTSLISQLPTNSQWKNTILFNEKRDITDEFGYVEKTGFSYSGYAARILSYEEVENSCGSSSLSKCNYFLENTSTTSGYWLETGTEDSSSYIWTVYSSGSISDYSTSNKRGCRPAIEVSKTSISF